MELVLLRCSKKNCFSNMGQSERKILERSICDALRNLISFVQFKKHKKHSWRNVTLRNVAGFSL